MIVITGAAGFIGSCLVAHLNQLGYKDLVLVDDFGRADKAKNLENKTYRECIVRDFFIEKWLAEHATDVEFIFHLGARTDTAETDIQLFNRLNLNYSKALWRICAKHEIPLVYASSAATYGSGEFGYEDKHALIPQLKPLNAYGDSKQDFDKWVLGVASSELRVASGEWRVDELENTDRVGERGLENRGEKSEPPYWAGLKFFNVYGPNEYHKGRMASVIFHCFNQVKNTGGMKLFCSHRAGIADGHQQRDFIYVKDVVKVCAFLMKQQEHKGIYNLGTGKARTFLDLTTNTFHAMGIAPNISFIDTPIDIRENYQYFTQATMDKLLGIGYDIPFHSLEEGIADYVRYLKYKKYL